MAAPADFVLQANADLEHGHARKLREVLNTPEDSIQYFLLQHAIGRRVIIDSVDYLQLVYRIQFRLGYQEDYTMFRHYATWTICHSPIELPVSDVALVQMPVHAHKSMFYALPVSPRLLLKGQIKFGTPPPSTQTVVKGMTLASDEADLWLQIICSAAINELVASNIIADVSAIRSRAKANEITFNKLVNPDLIIRAGTKNFTSNFGLKVVSLDEYKEYIAQFIQAPEK
jgi:hypothetical protein